MNEKVISILQGIMEEELPIELSSHLKNDLGLDSFSLAQLTVEIEDEFDVDIFEGDEFPQTVQDVIDRLV